jgi:hypothetical protein
LDICEERAMKENEKFRRMCIRSQASHLCHWRP